MEEKQKNFKQCDLCKSDAIYLCKECLYNYYCESCYKFIHDKKENANHKKEKIDYFLPIDKDVQNIRKFLLIYFVLMKKVI